MLSLMCRDPHGFIYELVILNVCQQFFKKELTFDTVSGMIFFFLLLYCITVRCNPVEQRKSSFSHNLKPTIALIV